MIRAICAALACLILVSACARAEEEKAKTDSEKADAKKPEPREFQSSGTVTAGGRAIRYKAIAGETFILDDKGEPRASIFSTSYVAEGFSDPKKRPVAFIYNGGPGSASLWLHMGVFGPKRVRLPDGPQDDGAAPFDVAPNPESILDVADLVFIDPVGTGWSKTLGEAKTDDFWGVSEDAQSIREFIRRWLVEHQRWNSPKYLIGESYGTTRSGALIDALESGWTDIAINGIVLISSVLNFSLDATDAGNDIGFAGLLPSYAATAWYHQKVDPAAWGGDFERFLSEARAFAKPVLLIYADDHNYRLVEKVAFEEGAEPAPNVTRMCVFGDRSRHAVMVVVDPDRPGLFLCGPLFVPGNALPTIMK